MSRPTTPRERGRLVVIEGPDGVGKSTVAERVRALLTAAAVPAACITASTGATEWAKRVNKAMHDREGSLPAPPSPLAFQMAAAACARDGYVRVIRPWMGAGITVICDRIHAVSSLIYGHIAGARPLALTALAALTEPPLVDAWFVLSAPWSVLQARRPPGNDVWDRRGESFAQLVAGAYSTLDGGNGDLERRIREATGWGPPTPIDAIGTADEVAREILRHLETNNG